MKNFVAQARIVLADPESVLAQVCTHMIEHDAEVEIHGNQRILRFLDSHARFTYENGATYIHVTAPSLEGIYFTRMALTSHILEFAQHEVPAIEWKGDGEDIARPPNFQIMEVVSCHFITPHMRRLTLHGADISRFSPMDALHLNILIQHPDCTEPQWPTVGNNGLIHWEDPQRRPVMRKYTVRSLDVETGMMVIDFVLHEDAGPGSALAMHVKTGDQLGIMGPGGGGLTQADWYLFAGDETALPAIGRMLEYLPEAARGIALIEVADANEIQALSTRSGVEVRWLLRNGAPAGTTQILAEAVEQIALPQDGSSLYVWAGCEFEAFRRIRGYLRNERGLSKHEHLVVSYWRKGKTET